MRRRQQIALLIGSVLVTTLSIKAQTGAVPQQCGQSVEVTNPLLIKAERAEFNVHRVTMLGHTRPSSRQLFRAVGPFINEGDIFSRRKLWAALKSLSRVKGIYPVTQKDLEITLDDANQFIDIVFCIREKPNPWSKAP